jgi:hypothetical protein
MLNIIIRVIIEGGRRHLHHPWFSELYTFRLEFILLFVPLGEVHSAIYIRKLKLRFASVQDGQR